LINYGFDNIYALLKIEAVGTEILFGYLIENILKLENESIHDCTLVECLINPINFKFIKKIASGQGYINAESINLKNIEIITNLIFVIKSNDLNDGYIKLIDVIDKNDDIEKLLLSTQNLYIETNNDILNKILPSIRHRLFTKKYFPSYYIIEKNNIINKNKILF
jgi:hypothetical protein